MRRKRIASSCLFLVDHRHLGAQIFEPFPVWLIALLVVAAAAFTWPSYARPLRLGWF